MEFVDMDQLTEELEVLSSHWDHRGVPPLTDPAGHDSRQDERLRSPPPDGSR